MQNAANDPIVEHLEAGQDVRIEGAAASARLDAVAAQLDDRYTVVRLTAPEAGLSLSGLIAQLSGRDRFDDQDDGALEIGFRRLCGWDTPDRRTVLLLDATHGVQRPVLRYLQQVAHNAPGLLFAIAATPELTALLGSPDMMRLRERLTTVVEAAASPARVPGRVLTVVPKAGLPALPTDWTIESRRRASMRRQRRSRRVALMWATSVVVAVVASTTVGAWLGQTRPNLRGGMMVNAKGLAPAVVTETDRRPQLALAPVLVPIQAGAPPLAVKVAPATTPRAPSVPADAADPAIPLPVPAPALVKLTAPEMVAAGEPPVAVPTKPETVSVALAKPDTAAFVPAKPDTATFMPAKPDTATFVPAKPDTATFMPAKPDTVTFASVEERLAAPTLHPRMSEAHRAPHPRLMARVRVPSVGSSGPSRFADESRPLPNYQVEDLPPEDAAPTPIPRRFRSRVARVPTSDDTEPFTGEVSRAGGDTDPSGAWNKQPGNAGYIGTYSTGPYGARVFRYGP